MKKNKLFALLLTTALATSVMVGCGEKTETPKDEPNTPPIEEPGEDVEEPEVVSTIRKAGLGIITSIDKSKDLGDDGATTQVDTTIAAVALDSEGKIVDVKIDVAQNKVVFDEGMQLITDVELMGETKKERKEAYGMKDISEIGKEWYEQIEALENWMIGKTIEEVKAMKVFERDASHVAVPDEEDLKSTVTITVDGYIAALEKAVANAVEVGGETLGLGHSISFAKSRSSLSEDPAIAQVDATIALTILDKDGKVAKTIIDTAQTKVEYSIDGIIMTSKEGEFKTKKELGYDYGMEMASGIGVEWFEQMESLENWMVGKTPDEVLDMSMEENVPAEEDLKSSVTVVVNSYLDAFREASEDAK